MFPCDDASCEHTNIQGRAAVDILALGADFIRVQVVGLIPAPEEGAILGRAVGYIPALVEVYTLGPAAGPTLVLAGDAIQGQGAGCIPVLAGDFTQALEAACTRVHRIILVLFLHGRYLSES